MVNGIFNRFWHDNLKALIRLFYRGFKSLSLSGWACVLTRIPGLFLNWKIPFCFFRPLRFAGHEFSPFIHPWKGFTRWLYLHEGTQRFPTIWNAVKQQALSGDLLDYTGDMSLVNSQNEVIIFILVWEYTLQYQSAREPGLFLLVWNGVVLAYFEGIKNRISSALIPIVRISEREHQLGFREGG